jgi:hypothetical protein
MDLLAHSEKFLWRCLLLLVPISASPLLLLGPGTLARPLAILPACLLLLSALTRFFFLRQRPRLTGEGFGFLGILTLYLTVVGLVVALDQPDYFFKGQTPLESFLRALLTWLIGLIFYAAARLQIRSISDIRETIFLLFVAMSGSVLLAFLQALAIAQQGELLKVTQAITDLFAFHYAGLVSRAQGMTFEPSWLATQILVFLMPPLIASSMAGKARIGGDNPRRWKWRLTGGFAVALGGLLSSGSRFGLVGVIALLSLSSLVAALRGRIFAILTFVLVLVAGGGGIAVMSGLGTGAGASYVVGPIAYLSEQAGLGAADADFATGVTDALALAGRFAAAQAAALTWLDHPVFGVSLGNGYRYFGVYAPDWAFATQLFTTGNKEGEGWLDGNSPEKGNAKNMILRLLSETGAIGFFCFIYFSSDRFFPVPFMTNIIAIFAWPARSPYSSAFSIRTVLSRPAYGFPWHCVFP